MASTAIRIHRPTGERYVLDGLTSGVVSDQIEISVWRDGQELEYRLIDDNGHLDRDGGLAGWATDEFRLTAKPMAAGYSPSFPVEVRVTRLGRMPVGYSRPDGSEPDAPVGRQELRRWTLRDLGL
jgi:hypothetical protein